MSTTLFLLALDPKALFSFLSTPRTITEVAEHFQLPLAQAERLVVGAIESGRVLVSSPSLALGRGDERLPQTTTQKVSTRLRVDYAKLRFELRRLGPNQVRNSSKPLDAGEFFAARKRPVRVSSVSPSVLKGLLERLEMSPKSVADLRDLGVSRRVLERLVRRKLLGEVWGSKGVGLLYEITQDGLDELKKLRELSSMAGQMAKRPLPTLKNRVPG